MVLMAATTRFRARWLGELSTNGVLTMAAAASARGRHCRSTMRLGWRVPGGEQREDEGLVGVGPRVAGQHDGGGRGGDGGSVQPREARVERNPPGEARSPR